MHWRRKWQPTPVFLPEESQGGGSLVGYRLWGRTESDTTEATQQQQQRASEEKLPRGVRVVDEKLFLASLPTPFLDITILTFSCYEIQKQ